MPRQLLIDGNSLTYRAFFALPTDMATASGQVTNAVFGFTSMLIYVINEQQPDGILVAFDRPEPTFRHTAEPEYKAQREAAPDILKQQMGLVREVLDALGIQQVEAIGWEADDLIASASKIMVEQGHDVTIVTGDRDSYQLVRDPHVKVMYNKRGVSDYALYDETGIQQRTGVTPDLYPQYAALRGDNSDNLLGVPGVGEKTAAKLINQYGGLDGIFAAIDEQTPKLRENLTEYQSRVRKNHDLMTLRTDAPLESVDFDNLAITPDPDEVKRLFEFLEFRTLGDRLADALGPDAAIAGSEPRAVLTVETTTATDADQVAAMIAELNYLDVAAAWEGDPGRSPLHGIAIVTDAAAGKALWVPTAIVTSAKVAAALASHSQLRGHQVKPLMRSLLDLGVELPGLVLDTAIAAYLIDPAEANYDLNGLIEKFTAFAPPADDPAASGQLDLDGTAVTPAVEAARRALAIPHLAKPFIAQLEAHGMRQLYETIENPLVWVLARMEHVGVSVDRDSLREINQRLTIEVDTLASELRHEAGMDELNLNSPTQLRQLLFEQRGLSGAGIKKTKSGYSTDAQSLQKLRDQWPEFIDRLLRHREVEKLRGTYGEGLLAEVQADGRIHATFNQTVARTGRLSSDQPNLHNIPVRSDAGRVFRTAFVASPGRQLLVADYNQIELRCIAHLSGDPGLVEAFTTNQDIHTATASRVFGVAPDAVTLDQRSKAKMVSYGLAYGMESYGLAQRLNIPTDEAAVILESYFEAFPSVKQYMDDTVGEARKNGFTETLFGRRRPIPELLNSNWRIRQAGERQAMNAGIQGLAADIFKVALVQIADALRGGNRATELILQVHDEVILDVPADEHDEVGDQVIDLMRHAATLDVPLEVNVAWGDTWAAAKG